MGGTDTLVATVSPANAADTTVTWSSGSPAVAEVSATGVVTAVSVGTTTVTATTADGGFTAACAVTVNAVPVTMKTGTAINTALKALWADSSPDKTFAASPSAPPAGAATQTLSSSGTYPVVAWLDGTVIKYYAQGYTDSNVKIPLNADSSKMFEGCEHLTSIDVSGFDTSNVTDMSRMFDCCDNLTSLNLSGFDTSNVTDMDNMFRGCSSLTSLNLSGFDTSNVTTMNMMFYYCNNLPNLDLSSFDTRAM